MLKFTVGIPIDFFQLDVISHLPRYEFFLHGYILLSRNIQFMELEGDYSAIVDCLCNESLTSCLPPFYS